MNPSESQLSATIRDFGWHMGANLYFALEARKSSSPIELNLGKVRMINFRIAAGDAKRHGTYRIFQEGAKAAMKGFLHNNKLTSK